MSDSRLEKFIYAICSMDVTDLPVPLSRIEKLWNCLITGETPDFEPLSRNEKYLMAMLDRYDISNLPAPMSRGEKLLYKIAVGETDLSDVPDYLSRYEELLKYLIENGGISGGDFEYVLYTLNQSLSTLYTTAEKPVKSAILKGQTLVNISSQLPLTNQVGATSTRIGGKVRINFANYTWSGGGLGYNEMIKPSTKYLFKVRFTNTCQFTVQPGHFKGWYAGIPTVSPNETFDATWVITTRSDIDTYGIIYWTLAKQNPADYQGNKYIDVEFLMIEYQEGMENWDIPFFEGMQSVKMPVLTTTNGSANILTDSQLNDKTGEIEPHNNSNKVIEDYILIPNNPVIISNVSWLKISFYDANKVYISNTGAANINKFELNDTTIPANAKYFRLHYNAVTLPLIRFVNGTDYIKATIGGEPYKTNILTVNEPIELRGIGDVQDTLDCLTGEVTQRIGEIVLDGSENWIKPSNQPTNTSRFLLVDFPNNKNAKILSNIRVKNNALEDAIGIWCDTNTVLNVDTSVDTVESLKVFLSENPIKLQYSLATESIKTVDLITVDQDNQPTKLGTFENVTRVSLESAGLIPEVEMEVATNLLEDTVFMLTNAFNTLYPTAAKPVVDGKLYGQTLVNLATQKSGRFNGTRFLRIPLSYTLNSNTNYFVNFVIKESTLTDGVTCRFKNTSTGITLGALKSSGIIATNANVADILEIYIDNTDDVTNGLDATIDDIMVIEYQDGMENRDIPYFEGMQSVQAPDVTMTGKNLFGGELETGSLSSSGIPVNDNNRKRSKDFYPFNGNFTYAMTNVEQLYFYDKDKNFISRSSNITNVSPTNTCFIKVRTTGSTEVQIEEGSVSTAYEPYKSTTLSTPSDLELRKVGEVQDEVNVMTGEVVERVGEFVLDGSDEYWDIVNNTFRTSIIRNKVISLETEADRDKIVISCDRYPSRTYNNPWLNNSGNFISLTVDRIIVINDTSFTTVGEWKEYLSQNPLAIKFVLATPTTKTVDLTVVNQDGNETKLRTFDDTTHVSLNSEGLIPTASLTVRTKIPSASSTSLLMDDISTNQQHLEATMDEQSNNVDATMIATTEIYEETL